MKQIYILWKDGVTMQFNSTPFLFLFLPVFLALYYLLPARC